MKKYLFLFTISPVQTFIAQARKTQDLYTGSRILSELVQAGINEFQAGEIIFPKLEDDAVSSPNRFIAMITKPVSELDAIGQKVENAVRKCFRDFSKQVLEQEKVIEPNGYFDQIGEHLSIHWAFEELADDYQDAYFDLESTIGSIKNIRSFKQFTYSGELGEKGRKCSLDGERNALFYKSTSASKRPPLLTKKGTVNLSSDKLNPGEGLSAIGFVKRFARWKEQQGNSFPSTAEISLLNDIDTLSAKEKELLNCLGSLHKKGKGLYTACLYLSEEKLIDSIELNNIEKQNDWQTHFDYQACYEENLIEQNYPNNVQLRLLKAAQHQLKRTLTSKYYALVMFDGDQMGKHLQSVTDLGLEAHTDFSQKLSKFAIEASNYVDDGNYGRTVYAGGDDYLGFINLHYLFEVMEQLRERFTKIVGSALHFSAGIVIAHYKIPLSEVLKTTRKVEKMAKVIGERNAFCITAIKHSGEIQQAVFKWGEGGKNWQALKKIVSRIKKEGEAEAKFSPKFIQNLTIEIGRLGGMNGRFSNDGIVKSEIKRLVNRSKNEGATRIETEKLVEVVCSLWDAFYERSEVGEERVHNFIHALHIADFISRKTN